MADQPTAEEMQQGADVATAAAEAAQAEPEPAKRRAAAKKAIQDTAPPSFQLSDEDAEKVANLVVDNMEARGAFEPPPAQLQPQPTNEPPAAAAPPSDQAAQAQVPEVPRSKSFAERFRGK